MVRMDLVSIGVAGEDDGGIVLVLKEQEGGRFLAMQIGPAEANAIAVAVGQVQVPRPLTHDLFSDTLAKLGAKVSSVAVVNFDDSTYFGRIYLETQGGKLELDARPSDAIALALRQGAPIFASDQVLLVAGIDPEETHEVH